MVIDEGVNVARARPVCPGAGRRLRGRERQRPAVGNAADLLHLHVDQLAWVVAFVSDRGRLRCLDHLASHRVKPGQVRPTATSQNP